jgi:hypothetical protein
MPKSGGRKMPNKVFFRTLFGSHIYGTNTPSSDRDYKSIFVPDGRELVLQKPSKHILNNTKTDMSKRNTLDDVDDEMYSIQTFMKLLLEGQTAQLDMLFTPEKYHVIQPGEAWLMIKENKDKFIHSGTSSFVGYCKTQAAKYGLKGGRVAALRKTLDYLHGFANDRDRLADLSRVQLDSLVKEIGDEAEIVTINNPKGQPELHLSVCNRKVPFHASLHYAREIFQKIFDQYGQRALQAEMNQNVDWKALMHAVRVADEAFELLTTGQITFPRPNADLLLKIRKGELAYKAVEELIEQGLVNVESAKEKSTLRKHPDYKFADELIYEIHLQAINSQTNERS